VSLSREQANRLFSIRRPEEVHGLLDTLGVDSSNSWQWLPLGGRQANATNVELATEQTPPIIERITNGMDAVIERAKAGSDLEPASPGMRWSTGLGYREEPWPD